MKSIFDIFKKGLQKSKTSVARTFAAAFSGVKTWDENTYDELEAALLSADFGVKTTLRIVNDLRDRYQRGMIHTTADINAAAAADVAEALRQTARPITLAADGPTVIIFVGVNGSGKTTSVGKLAALWREEGRKVMLAACDTFRAGAVEQLKLWGERTGSSVISSFQGADPAAVAFDAAQAAVARGVDILLLDTAGRQHTHKGLMDELAKVRRSLEKAYPGAPHEVWLTVDASLGGNAINQAREFTKTAGVTGLVLTKLDGTGKGGMAVAIQEEFKLPVFFVGLGEQPGDLQPFDPDFYAQAIFCRED